MLISGCRDSELSYETEVDDGRGGETRKHGALTYHLQQALRNAKPGDTYRDIHERVAPLVFANNPNQNPQIHGSLDRTLFGAEEIVPLAFFRLTDVRDDGSVTIAAGSAHGLTPGSIWTVVEPESRAVTDDYTGLRRADHRGPRRGVVRRSRVRNQARRTLRSRSDSGPWRRSGTSATSA